MNWKFLRLLCLNHVFKFLTGLNQSFGKAYCKPDRVSFMLPLEHSVRYKRLLVVVQLLRFPGTSEVLLGGCSAIHALVSCTGTPLPGRRCQKLLPGITESDRTLGIDVRRVDLGG